MGNMGCSEASSFRPLIQSNEMLVVIQLNSDKVEHFKKLASYSWLPAYEDMPT